MKNKSFLIALLVLMSFNSHAQLEILHIFDTHNFGPVMMSPDGPRLTFTQGYLMGKVHSVTVTETDLLYEGNIPLDQERYFGGRIHGGFVRKNRDPKANKARQIDLMVGVKKLRGYQNSLDSDSIFFGSLDCATDGFVIEFGDETVFDSTEKFTCWLNGFLRQGEDDTPVEFKSSPHDQTAKTELLNKFGLVTSDKMQAEIDVEIAKQVKNNWGDYFKQEEIQALLKRTDYERQFMVSYDANYQRLHVFGYRHFPDGTLLCDLELEDKVEVRFIQKGMAIFSSLNVTSFLNGALKFNFSDDFYPQKKMPSFVFRVVQ